MEFCYWHLKTFSSFSKRNKIENFSTFGSQNKIENLLEIVEAECVELVTLKCIFRDFSFCKKVEKKILKVKTQNNS